MTQTTNFSIGERKAVIEMFRRLLDVWASPREQEQHRTEAERLLEKLEVK